MDDQTKQEMMAMADQMMQMAQRIMEICGPAAGGAGAQPKASEVLYGGQGQGGM